MSCVQFLKQIQRELVAFLNGISERIEEWENNNEEESEEQVQKVARTKKIKKMRGSLTVFRKMETKNIKQKNPNVQDIDELVLEVWRKMSKEQQLKYVRLSEVPEKKPLKRSQKQNQKNQKDKQDKPGRKRHNSP